MATLAAGAYGTLFKIGSTAVAEVNKIDFSGIKLDTVEATSHASTGGWREYVPTLKDGGEVTLELSYVPTAATHKNASGGLLYLLDQKTLQNFAVVFADGPTTWTLPGFVTSYKPSAPVDGKLGLSVTIKVSGQPTLA
jgi:hypothetical protein